MAGDTEKGDMYIESWSKLAELIEEHADAPWIFRGQSADDIPLRPKAGRVGGEHGTARKKPYDPHHEIEALRLFKREAQPYLGHRPETDMEWLAIAEHHGMVTRLLDWTESLLVAAYFAVADAGVRGPAVIYAARGVPHVSEDEERKPFEIEEVRFYRPPHITPRIPAQRGVFTIHPHPVEEYAPPSLTKRIIRPDACARIKHVLDTCGINESSLFPDIDGLSRYIGWRYKWGKFADR